jgi:hypothetical protein
LREATLQDVAVGQAHALVIDVGLDDETLAGLVAILEVVADPQHGEGDFVAQHHWIGLHVAAAQAGVSLPGLDDLGIGEAQAHRVVPHQQLVRPASGRGHLDRLFVAPQVLQAGAVERPEPVARRERGITAAVRRQFRIRVQGIAVHLHLLEMARQSRLA